jgi:hypothetical protein
MNSFDTEEECGPRPCSAGPCSLTLKRVLAAAMLSGAVAVGPAFADAGPAFNGAALSDASFGEVDEASIGAPEGAALHDGRMGQWHLDFHYRNFGDWPGYYPHLRWQDGASDDGRRAGDTSVKYCPDPAGYSSVVKDCNAPWQRVVIDPLPAEPKPAN